MIKKDIKKRIVIVAILGTVLCTLVSCIDWFPAPEEDYTSLTSLTSLTNTSLTDLENLDTLDNSEKETFFLENCIGENNIWDWTSGKITHYSTLGKNWKLLFNSSNNRYFYITETKPYKIMFESAAFTGELNIYPSEDFLTGTIQGEDGDTVSLTYIIEEESQTMTVKRAEETVTFTLRNEE